MKVDLFDFDLPAENIAQHPAEPRDSARMLDLSNDESQDRIVRDLVDCLHAGDLIVCNDTKVLPTRLTGKRGDARVEVTLHKCLNANTWQAFAKPAKKLRVGETLVITPDFEAIVLDKLETGEVILAFNLSGDELRAALWEYAIMPLPPYIKRTKGGDDQEECQDRQDYQTLFARVEGAVAAPTAGLHFTDAMRDALTAKEVGIQTITLHVGAGTFLPVKVDDTDDHIMHSEWGCITDTQAARINNVRANGGRILAIGTTSMRLLESATTNEGIVKPFEGNTDIFITPGYKFRAVDMLLTNFHLPKSTLFMLISAFAGFERMKHAYKDAIESGYRFYSFGDCCLLKRDISND